jgi:hypothetical protein
MWLDRSSLFGSPLVATPEQPPTFNAAVTTRSRNRELSLTTPAAQRVCRQSA